MRESIKQYLKWLAPLSAAALVACSGTGTVNSSSGSNQNNGDASTLQIIAQKIIYSKAASISSGYVTVLNPSTTAVKNLHYSLSSKIGSGTVTTIDETTAGNCVIIPANSQCNIKLNVAAGAIAGSLAFSANNDSSLVGKLFKASQSATTATLPVGIEQAYYNSVTGADGITISYYHTVIAGVPYVLVSGIVASDKTGSFNNIVLVDGNGNKLPNQQLISGNVSSIQGSTFSILLPVSASSGISQTIKVQTQQVASDGSVTVVSTATAANTLTTTSGVGITDMLPGAVYLTAANPEQIITFANSGDVQAQLQSFAASNPNIEVTFSPTSLAIGGTATATLKLKNPALPATSGSVTLNYNNGKEEVKATAVTEQNVSPEPNPNPSPTPTPTSAPVPSTPTAGLTTAFSPDSDFFTTTAVGAVSRQLTLTNSGNTAENSFVLTLPTNFTISDGTANSCTVTQAASPATISDSLAASSGNCTVTVTYTNTTATAQNTGDISIAYNYNSGTAATPVTAGVNYKVTQSTANLSLTPNTVSFSNVLNNGVDFNQQIVTVTNSGDTTATNLAFNINGTDSALFSVVSGGTCVSGGSLNNAIGNNSCTVTTQFGTAASSTAAGDKTASLNVNYMPYSNGTTATASNALSGHIVTAQSANIALGAATPSGFDGGDGSNATPYEIQQNATSPTISYTITNSGTVPATSFYLSGTASGYTFSGCGTSANPITVAGSNGTCTATFTLSSTATTGTQNLNLSGITMHWSDQANPGGTSQILSGTDYVNVYASATIAITTNPTSNISVAPGDSFTIIATLTGGYAEQTINAALTTGATSDTTFSNNDCAVSSQNRTCTITANVSASATVAAGNIITISNTAASPAATPVPSTVTFAIAVAPAVVQIALPQTGQMNQVPSMCYPLSATCINSPVGSDGYGYASGPYDIPYGVAWAYNGYTDLVPPVRFTPSSAADGSTCPSGQLVESDNLTGLMWQQNPSTTTYKWQDGTVTPNTYPALAAVESLNSGSGYCGYTDWRLPNLNELVSMLNLGQKVPYTWLNTSGFPGVGNFSYWSSTTMVAGSGSSAWVVMLDNTGYGRIATQGKTSFTAPIWAVRGNSATSTAPAKIPQTGQTTSYAAGDDGALQAGTAGTNVSGRFKSGTLLEADCITDSQTGLMWPKNGIIGFTATSGGSLISQPNYSNTDPDLNSITWYDALTAMTKMNTATTKLCGYSDWRLPNFAELRSLINYGQVNYSISSNWLNDQGFSGVQNKKYWTSTIFASTPSSTMWLIDMGIGEASFNGGQYNPYPVLPVRGGGAAGS